MVVLEKREYLLPHSSIVFLPLSSLPLFLSFLFPSRRSSLKPFIENSVSRTVCDSPLYCWKWSGAGIVITVATTK